MNTHGKLSKRIKQKFIKQLVAPGAQAAIDQMKFEIASEFGVNLGPDTTACANGFFGAEITKCLVQLREKLGSRY
uniref:Protein SspS n=1 Tax=Streptococcus pyogenes TaxID=1314 RepID=SSPS_STRPY|nr:RecName: Full=Protein SspS [Streptococcus pyogenes]